MEWLKPLLKNSTERGKYDSGVALYQSGVVTNVYAKEEQGVLMIYGSVVDDYRRQTYSCMLRVDTARHILLESSCDCHAIAHQHAGPEVCSHIVAATYAGINKIKQLFDAPSEEQMMQPLIHLSFEKMKKGYLPMAFEIEGIDRKEYRRIFTAYKEGKKAVYLGNERYLSLEEPKLRQVLNLIDVLGVYNEIDNIKIGREKLPYLQQQLQGMDFVSNDNLVKESLDKIKQHPVCRELPSNLTSLLRDYQKEGVNFLCTAASYGTGGILADEMGLGKTLQMITFLAMQQNTQSLIITPTALIYNWVHEIERFAPNLKVGIVHGTKEKRSKILSHLSDYEIILTTYGTYRNDQVAYEELIFDYVVIDEAQQIKNPEAQLTRVIKQVKSKVRFALTGTPMENHLLELWSLFDFVLPGYLYSELRFRNIFMTQPPKVEELKQLVQPLMLRRTKKDVLTELPDKIEQKVVLTLETHHQHAYWAMKKLIKERIQQNSEDKMALLAYLTKLRQLCLMPEKMVRSYKGRNTKIDYLVQLLKAYPEEKILVFSQFTTVLKEIGERLKEENIAYYYMDGSTQAEQRLARVNDFNEGIEKKVFLISLKAGGTGLNLTSASMVIHFDPWWNPAVEDQASDRAHRMGQKQVVTVIKLIAEGTIEERVAYLQESKKALINSILVAGEGQHLATLSIEEIKDLLLS